MKSVLGLVVTMMLVAPGCGDDTTSTTGADLSVTTPADMTVVVGKDMTPAKPATCSQAVACVQGCLAPSQTNPLGCATACGSSLPTDQKNEFTALFTCVVMHSQSPADGGGTFFDASKVVSTITPPNGACLQQYGICTGAIGLDH